MGSLPRVMVVIPARYGSTRLPTKPLADINGKPMIQWVYERAKKTRGVDRVIVATDHEKIESVVKKFGGDVMMTSPDLKSGTDRVAAIADRVSGDIFVNVQGDEPLIEGPVIEKGLALVQSGRFAMATVMTPIKATAELDDPSVVKVIADSSGRAIYFSRFGIPYSRGPRPEGEGAFACFRHVGLYIYTRETLMRFRDLPVSAFEQAEVLEQLRALQNGIPIGIAEVGFTSIGVDNQDDLEKVRRILV